MQFQTKENRERRAELSGQMKRMAETVQAEKRDFTDEETRKFDELETECQRLLREEQTTTLQPSRYHVDTDPAADIAGPGLRFRNLRTGEIVRSIPPYERLPGADPSLSIGRCIYSVLTNRIQDLSPEERASMLGGSDTGGGYLLVPQLSANVTDLARAASVAIRAGANILPMDTAEMLLTRVSGDPTAYWRAETQAVTSTNITFDRISLKPKTLAAIIPVSIELLEDAQNAATVIETTLRRAMGAKLDHAILQGSGAANEPTGIVNTTNVTSSTDIKLPSNYNHVSAAVGDVLQNNYQGDLSDLAWISHPRDLEILDQLQDTTNQPMRPTPWVEQLMRFNTTGLDISTTSSLTETKSIVGDFSQVVVGVRTDNVVVRILDAGTVTDGDSNTWNANTQLMRHIVAYLRADVAILQPSWFTVINGIQTEAS